MLVGLAFSTIGAIIGSTLSVIYLADLETFRPVLGMLVLGIALQILWQLLHYRRHGDTHTGRAAAAFEGLVHDGGSPCTIGVKHLWYSLHRIVFEFGSEQFSCLSWISILTGVGIALVSSALGVDDGFLLVSFMTILLGLPMFILTGTAALSRAVSSIANYIQLRIELDISFLLLLTGTIAGAWIGPRLSR
ncbi:MAG: sulfite exporter TauE/SafE family protein [Gammaproteobacteria bacterium]|nr:sulfite exporter TauE/SafE family protein [Gammaproteobacteria bacterium]